MVISALGLDVTTGPHLEGVLGPVVDEVDVSDLNIGGELPAEIESPPLRTSRRAAGLHGAWLPSAE